MVWVGGSATAPRCEQSRGHHLRVASRYAAAGDGAAARRRSILLVHLLPTRNAIAARRTNRDRLRLIRERSSRAFSSSLSRRSRSSLYFAHATSSQLSTLYRATSSRRFLRFFRGEAGAPVASPRRSECAHERPKPQLEPDPSQQSSQAGYLTETFFGASPRLQSGGSRSRFVVRVADRCCRGCGLS